MEDRDGAKHSAMHKTACPSQRLTKSKMSVVPELTNHARLTRRGTGSKQEGASLILPHPALAAPPCTPYWQSLRRSCRPSRTMDLSLSQHHKAKYRGMGLLPNANELITGTSVAGQVLRASKATMADIGAVLQQCLAHWRCSAESGMQQTLIQ